MLKVSRTLSPRNLFLATTLFSAGIITGASLSNFSKNSKTQDLQGIPSASISNSSAYEEVTPSVYLPLPDEKKKNTLSGIDADALNTEKLKNRALEKEELKNLSDLRTKIIRAANYTKIATVAVSSSGGFASGFIYSSDDTGSIIITNNHVVEMDVIYRDQRGRETKKKEVPDEIKITLIDGREISGKVIGRDSEFDVAVIETKEKNLPVLGLATAYPEYNDFVISVGHPLDFGWTPVVGNYSGNDRGLDTKVLKTNMIHVTATINPGHSGGPLVNLNGELIGINYGVIRGKENEFDGLSFFIPYEAIDKVVKNVLEKVVSSNKD